MTVAVVLELNVLSLEATATDLNCAGAFFCGVSVACGDLDYPRFSDEVLAPPIPLFHSTQMRITLLIVLKPRILSFEATATIFEPRRSFLSKCF